MGAWGREVPTVVCAAPWCGGVGGGTDRNRESTLGDGNDVDRYGESGTMN